MTVTQLRQLRRTLIDLADAIPRMTPGQILDLPSKLRGLAGEMLIPTSPDDIRVVDPPEALRRLFSTWAHAEKDPNGWADAREGTDLGHAHRGLPHNLALMSPAQWFGAIGLEVQYQSCRGPSVSDFRIRFVPFECYASKEPK